MLSTTAWCSSTTPRCTTDIWTDERHLGRPVVRTDHLGRRVGEVWIVDDVSLDVQRCELLGIVGASGSGKSSLLRLLNRLDEPTSGTVFLDNQDYRQIPPRTAPTDLSAAW